VGNLERVGESVDDLEAEKEFVEQRVGKGFDGEDEAVLVPPPPDPGEFEAIESVGEGEGEGESEMLCEGLQEREGEGDDDGEFETWLVGEGS